MAKPSELPEWNENESNNITPDAQHKADGWLIVGTVPEKPKLQFFNQWMWNVYQWLKYNNVRGIAEWDSTTTYNINDMVTGSDGYVYQSRISANLNNDPTSTIVPAWKLGFKNPSLVIGGEQGIDLPNRLQVVDSTNAQMECSTGQGASKQRLSMSQTSTKGTIESYDNNAVTTLPLDLNPLGGRVTINRYEICAADNNLESVALSQVLTAAPALVFSLSVADDVATGSELYFNFQLSGTVIGVGYLTTRIVSTAGPGITGPLTPIVENTIYTTAAGMELTFPMTIRYTSSGLLTVGIYFAHSAGATTNIGVSGGWIRKKLS